VSDDEAKFKKIDREIASTNSEIDALRSKVDQCWEAASLHSQKLKRVAQDQRTNRSRLETVTSQLESCTGRIKSLQETADDLATTFRRLYAESVDAYESGDGELAAELAQEGHEAQDDCECLNIRCNELRSDKRLLYQSLNRLNSQSDHLASEIETITSSRQRLVDAAKKSGSAVIQLEHKLTSLMRDRLPLLYKQRRQGDGLAPVVGFERFPGVSSAEVRKFLIESIPTRHLEYVSEFRYSGRSYVIGESVVVAFAPKRSDAVIINKPPYRLDLRYLLAHEIGEIVNFKLSSAVRIAFVRIMEETPTWISQQSGHDLFAECYAQYILQPDRLQKVCPLRFAFLRDKVFKAIV
jgi:predicted  nucleic acid-binding Zn-ribbon protein